MKWESEDELIYYNIDIELIYIIPHTVLPCIRNFTVLPCILTMHGSTHRNMNAQRLYDSIPVC